MKNKLTMPMKKEMGNQYSIRWTGTCPWLDGLGEAGEEPKWKEVKK